MFTSLIVKIDRKAEENIHDRSTDNARGVAKAAGHGALLGIFDGLIIVGAAYCVYAIFDLIKTNILKK